MKKLIATLSCSSCHTYKNCLVGQMPLDDQPAIEQMITQRVRLKRGENLGVQGDEVTALYLIKFGDLKKSILTKDGYEQVTGFRHAGDIVGLDGWLKKKQPSNATVLIESEVCVLSISKIQRLEAVLHEVNTRLFERMQNDISELNKLLAEINSKHAIGRLGTFFLAQSEKQKKMGFSPTHLRLPMTRIEMGNYLGLKVETVSRNLKQLELLGIIKIDRRNILIQNIQALKNCQDKFLMDS